MITGKLATLANALLPLIYRRCPMGHAHLKSDMICECCKGNEFALVHGKWVPLKYAPMVESGNHSSLSWSGQLSSGELWLSAIKQGLILALILGSLIGIGVWYTHGIEGRQIRIENNDEY